MALSSTHLYPRLYSQWLRKMDPSMYNMWVSLCRIPLLRVKFPAAFWRHSIWKWLSSPDRSWHPICNRFKTDNWSIEYYKLTFSRPSTGNHIVSFKFLSVAGYLFVQNMQRTHSLPCVEKHSIWNSRVIHSKTFIQMSKTFANKTEIYILSYSTILQKIDLC